MPKRQVPDLGFVEEGSSPKRSRVTAPTSSSPDSSPDGSKLKPEGDYRPSKRLGTPEILITSTPPPSLRPQLLNLLAQPAGSGPEVNGDSTRPSSLPWAQMIDENPLLEAPELTQRHSITNVPDEKGPTIYTSSPYHDPTSSDQETPRVNAFHKDPVCGRPHSPLRSQVVTPKESSSIGLGATRKDPTEDIYVPSPNSGNDGLDGVTGLMQQVPHNPFLERASLSSLTDSYYSEGNNDMFSPDSQVSQFGNLRDARPFAESFREENPSNISYTHTDLEQDEFTTDFSIVPPSRRPEIPSQSNILPNASEVVFEGNNTLNCAGRDIYNINTLAVRTDSPQLIGPSSSTMVPAASTFMSGSAPSSRGTLVREGEHDSETYARLLLPKRHGWPLWVPRPLRNLPEAYRKRGIDIGDVGIITTTGEFDFFFNICLPADDPINRNSVPDNFEPINHPENLEDVNFDPEAWMPEGYVVTSSVSKQASIQAIDDSTPRSPHYQFIVSAPAGALLLMPRGGSRRELLNTLPFEAYAKKHGPSWYKHINGPRGRGAANGSVYLITGVDKTQVWGTGVYSWLAQDVIPDPLTFRKADAGFSDSKYEYMWTRSYPASTKYGPLKEFFDGSSELPHNQCTFIRGFRVALNESLWRSLIGSRVQVSCIQNTSASSLLQKSCDRDSPPAGSSPMSSYFGFSGGYSPFGMGRSTGHASKAGGTATIISETPGPSMTLHPSDIINRHLLHENKHVDVAVTHDSVWCSAVDEDASRLPNLRDMLSRIEERYKPVFSDGGISYQPKEIGSNSSKSSAGTDFTQHYSERALQTEVLLSDGFRWVLRKPKAIPLSNRRKLYHQAPRVSYEPSLDFCRKIWWDSLLSLYLLPSATNRQAVSASQRNIAAREITSDIRFLFRKSNYCFPFFHKPTFVRNFFDPTRRQKMQPSLVMAMLALSRLWQSFDVGFGRSGRERALRLRDEAQAALDASFNAGWIDETLAHAAWLLALFEDCAHPLHSSERSTSPMHMLNSLIRGLSVIFVDADDPDTDILSPGEVPAVPLGLQATPPDSSLLANLSSSRFPLSSHFLGSGIDHASTSCNRRSLMLDESRSESQQHTPLWSSTTAWGSTWDETEIRRESFRRLCWSSIILAAYRAYHSSAKGTNILPLFIADPSNILTLLRASSLSFREGLN